MTEIVVDVDDIQLERAKRFSEVFGYLMINIAVMLAPIDTGNLRRSITLTQNNKSRKQIRYNLMSANYIRFLEEGLGYVKKYQGFISVDTKMAIVEGVIDFILTGDYPFYSFAPKITLSSTSKIFSKEKQLLKEHEIKTDKISADVRQQISKIREIEFRKQNGSNDFSIKGQKINTTKSFVYGSNRGKSVLSKAYTRIKGSSGEINNG